MASNFKKQSIKQWWLATIMKNKIHIIISLLVLIIVSCGQNSFEKELNGKWYGLDNDGYTRMFFYPDSLVITEIGPIQNVQWTANKSRIEFDYQMIMDSTDSSLKTKYILSESRDTLFCKIIDSVEERSFHLIRADNYLNYLSRKNKIDFELPVDNEVKHFDLDRRYAFKIFIGTKNGGLKVMTEYGNGLDSIKTDLQKFKQKINPKSEYEESKMYHESHFRIFADKSISNEKLKKHIQELTKSEIYKVFRIYKSKEHKNLGYMRGERIKNITSDGYDK